MDTQYPKPNRQRPMVKEEAISFPDRRQPIRLIPKPSQLEIDLGTKDVIFSDGRPAVIEEWFDKETRCSFRSIFYSSKGLDAWNLEQHRSYLISNHAIDVGDQFEVKHVKDYSDEDLCVVTLVLADDDGDGVI